MLTIIAILQKKPMISESESDSEDSLPSVSKSAVRSFPHNSFVKIECIYFIITIEKAHDLSRQCMKITLGLRWVVGHGYACTNGMQLSRSKKHKNKVSRYMRALIITNSCETGAIS